MSSSNTSSSKFSPDIYYYLFLTIAILVDGFIFITIRWQPKKYIKFVYISYGQCFEKMNNE